MLETNRFTLYYLAISVGLFSLSLGLCWIIGDNLTWNRYDILLCASSILVGVPSAFGCWFFARLAFLPISDLHSMKTAACHCLISVLFNMSAPKAMEDLKKLLRNPRLAQEKLLREILDENGDTEYGRKYNLSSVTDRDDFKRRHPLSTYEDYRSYIDRIEENNELNLLSKKPITRFSVSSGTSGKCKLLPTTFELPKVLKLLTPFYYLVSKLARHSQLAPLKHSQMSFCPKWRYSKHGVLIGPASGVQEKDRSAVYLWMRTLPAEAEVYLSEPAQTYLHWLFSLMDRNVARIDGVYAGTFIVTLELLRQQWPQLVDDIRQGSITRNNPDLPLEVIQRIEAAGHLRPNPKRAAELEREFQKGFQGILERIFPRLYAVLGVTTGAHAIYVERVRWYMGETVHLISPLYGASEGFIASNLTPTRRDVVYTLHPLAAFFEFIPESLASQPNPPTLFIDQLQSGCRYEIVLTNTTGFYRYRLGDIVEVAGFSSEGPTPLIRFCARLGSTLDLRGEKTNEAMISSALKAAISSWKGCRDLVDYTSTECVSLAKVVSKSANLNDEVGLHYVLFVELDGVERPLTRDEVLKFDSQLSEITYPYKSFRDKQAIGEPLIYVVKAGTFAQMKMEILQRNSAVSNQYKTPRYISDAERLQFLLDSSYNKNLK